MHTETTAYAPTCSMNRVVLSLSIFYDIIFSTVLYHFHCCVLSPPLIIAFFFRSLFVFYIYLVLCDTRCGGTSAVGLWQTTSKSHQVAIHLVSNGYTQTVHTPRPIKMHLHSLTHSHTHTYMYGLASQRGNEADNGNYRPILCHFCEVDKRRRITWEWFSRKVCLITNTHKTEDILRARYQLVSVDQ